MGPKIYFRRKTGKKPVFVTAEAETAADSENDDSMTLMDVMRVVQKPTRKQLPKQHQTRLTELAAEGENEYHEVIIAATELSSGSDEDLGSVVCQYKRKRKCKDLRDILDSPVVTCLTNSHAHYEDSQPRKAKKLEPVRQKGHVVNASRDGRCRIPAEARPPAPTLPRSKGIHGSSPVGRQTDDLRGMMDTMISFSDPVDLFKSAAIADDPALDVGKRQRFRGTTATLKRPSSSVSKAGREARSSSQSEIRHKSDPEADLHTVSSANLHTCADAKNCNNACVARAVAPNLDHMSEEELIYWYEEVTKNKFTSRNGEKVRGRIRRVIRAEAKRLPALSESSDDKNKSSITTCDEVEKCDSSLEPRTPSPVKLVVDIYLQDRPRASEFPASSGSKQDILCAFNSVACFEEDVGEEVEKTSSNRSEGLAGTAVPHKYEFEPSDPGLCREEDLPLKRELLEIPPMIEFVESTEAKSIPIDIALDASHEPDSLVELDIEFGDASSPSSQKMTLAEENCDLIVNRSHSGRSEGQALLPSAESGTGIEHVEGTSSPNGRDMGTSEKLAMDITSHCMQAEVLSRIGGECGVRNQAEAEVSLTEITIKSSTSQELEGPGTGRPKENEVLSCRSPEDCTTPNLDGGAACVEIMEKDVTAWTMLNCCNQLDGALCAEDVSMTEPDKEVPCEATKEIILQKHGTDGIANEDDEVFATQEIVEMIPASGQLPQDDLTLSDNEDDTPPQESEKSLYAPFSEELGTSRQIPDGTTQEAKDESPIQLDDDITQREHELPGSGEHANENQAYLHAAPSPVAGGDVPPFEEDIASRRMEEAALQSLEGNVAHDQLTQMSVSSLSGRGPAQSPNEEVVSLQQMDSTGVSGCQLGEDGASERTEDVAELLPVQGVVEVGDDHTASADHFNNVARANKFSEKTGEDSLEYPVVLSQPRRSVSEEDDLHETVNDVQMTLFTSSLSRRITRASLKLENSTLVVEEKLVRSSKLSSPQSSGANLVLPQCPVTWASDLDPQSGERSKTSVAAPADQSRRSTARFSPISEAEITQIDNFEFAMLQEDEWQNACKFSNQIDMSFFEEDLAVSSPRKRKFNDRANDSDRGKRVAVEAPLQEVNFGCVLSVQDEASQRGTEGNSMEDEHIPTALSRAKIEKNGERSGAVYTFPSLTDQDCPLREQQSNSKQMLRRLISREKRKVLLEHSPGLSSDSATTAESAGCIDLQAPEKLGEEESSQDFELPSKLLCMRKTISPLSQFELMRASNSNSPPPSDDSSREKIPAFRLKLPPGPDSQHGGSPFEREPTPGMYLEPMNKTGHDNASSGVVVSLDSSEDDTDDSCSRQEQGSRGSGGEPPRKFSLCLSPISTSPDSVRTDSSPSISSQEPRDSQSVSAPSSKGILKTGRQACKEPCKSRSNAGNAADFIASQMKTFQLIAGRLTKEMQILRAIIETNLSSSELSSPGETGTVIETNFCSPGESGKIQETMKKSKLVEEAAEKNLASLRRDCKRYCKLTAMKPMRKIVFADEAGKTLCHVKTFSSQSLPKSVLDLL